MAYQLLKGVGQEGESEPTERFLAFIRWFPTSLCRLSLPRQREDHEALKVVHQIFQPNLRSSPDDANGANQLAAHGRHLVTKDMFDAGSNAGAASVAGFLLSRQRRIARPFVVNLGA